MKKDDIVEVSGFSMGGERVTEGQAVIVKLESAHENYPEENIWLVRFKGDRGVTYSRKQKDMVIIKEAS